MARSKDKKRRIKLERAGRFNPELKRQSWGEIKPIERKTPTLLEKSMKLQTKHNRKWNSYEKDKDSIFFVC